VFTWTRVCCPRRVCQPCSLDLCLSPLSPPFPQLILDDPSVLALRLPSASYSSLEVMYTAVHCASNDLYVISARDFSTTLLQTSGEPPTPRAEHGAALRVIGTTLLICGGTTNGKANFSDQNVIYHDSLYLLNFSTSESSPTSADHNFALQYRESGPVLWPMVLGPMIVTTKRTQPQPWSFMPIVTAVK
jgi:hypothetical protein